MTGIFALALTALALSPPAPAPTGAEAVIARWIHATGSDQPRVNVWVNRDDPYRRGDDARVYFKTDRDAYITIVRIDTDGRLRVLFPIDPWEDNFARGGRTFEVLGRNRDQAFRVDDAPGVGYIFGIASLDRFDYDQIVRGDHWDYRVISDGRVRGDPYVALSDLAERITAQSDYDYDVAEYYVEQHYDYPRFVCYDCHAYASWHYWDPYSAYCSRFRIVIYNDPYYYPYRYYGTGVVVVRPHRPGPRYVFKDADPRNDYITRVAQRPRTGDDSRRTVTRDRTSADVGGRGAVPAPVAPRTRRTTDDRRTGTDRTQSSPADDARRRPQSRDGGSSDQPSRQPDTIDRGNSSPDRPAQPDNQNEPRRRPDTIDRGNSSPDRPAQPDNRDEPRRRPDTIERGNSSPDRPAQPDTRSEPRRSAPDRGSSADAPRPAPRPDPPQRSAPDNRGTAREPSRAAPPPRAQPSPRSTGEPQLKRRRP